MSVIVARALPDARDGPPVHRRIPAPCTTWACGPTPPSQRAPASWAKCWANITPRRQLGLRRHGAHGPDFSMRHPGRRAGQLQQRRRRQPGGHALHRGPAGPIALELPEDPDKTPSITPPTSTTRWRSPTCCRRGCPICCSTASSGIAVGMATNIPPHNLAELCDAIIYLIDRQDDDNVTLDELMEFVKAGLPHQRRHHRQRGHPQRLRHRPPRVVMRGVAEIEPNPRHP